MDEGEENIFEAMEATMDEAFETASEDDTQPRDDAGRFASASEDAPVEEAPDVDVEDTGDEPESSDDDNIVDDANDDPDPDEDAASATVDAPDSWTAEARERFSKLDPETQAYIVQREQEQSEGVAKLKTQFEEKATAADQWAELVMPYEGQMRAEGATPHQAVQNLLNVAQVLRTGTAEQKAAILHQTAQQFGVPLNTEPGSEPADPNYAALQSEVGQLKSYIQQLEAGRQAEAQQTITGTIESFATARDEKGDARYPHFETVRTHMGALMDAGSAETMEDAYEQAVWANPDTRKMEQDRLNKEAEQKRMKEAEKSATNAQKGKNVKPKGTRKAASTKASANPKDWEKGLEEVYDQVSAA